MLSSDGSLWTAGENIFGQLSGDTTDRTIFTKVQGVPAVKHVAAGPWHCIAVAEDGEVKF